MTTPLTASGLHALRELLSDHLGIEWDVLTVGGCGYLQVLSVHGERAAIVQVDRYRVVWDLQGMSMSGRPQLSYQFTGFGWRSELLDHVAALACAKSRTYQLCGFCRRERGQVVSDGWRCDSCAARGGR